MCLEWILWDIFVYCSTHDYMHMLNLSYICSVLQKKSLGVHLLEQVYYHLDIVEKDYFGLQFTDPYNVPHWLDPTKLVKKQVKSEFLLL